MGIICDSIDIVGSDVHQVTLDCINRMMDEEEGDALTILAGQDMSDEDFEKLIEAIEEAQPIWRSTPIVASSPCIPSSSPSNRFSIAWPQT